MALTKASYSLLTGSPINVLDYGVDPSGNADSTAGLQAAITAAASAKKSVYVPAGTYKYTTLTIAASITMYGDGESSRLYATNTTANNITVTTVDPVIFEKLGFVSLGTQTAGSYIQFNPASGENRSSIIKDCWFREHYVAIDFVKAYGWTVQTCYFGTQGPAGTKHIYVRNTFEVDSGDSTITGNNFYFANNLGSAIYQESSGGLRVINNKFLYGAYHYRMNLNGTTSNLFIQNNSTEFAAIANIIIDADSGVTFNNILITDNEFTVGAGGYGVLFNNNGSTWCDGIVIANNSFGANAAVTSTIALNSVRAVYLGPNVYRMPAGSAGVTVGANIINLDVAPQDYTTLAGSITAANVYINNVKSKYFLLVSGGSVAIPLASSLVNSVASVTVGGDVNTVGPVTGQYIVTGSSTVTTVQAISNVTVTTNGTSITVTNNTGQSFAGKILVYY